MMLRKQIIRAIEQVIDMTVELKSEKIVRVMQEKNGEKSISVRGNSMCKCFTLDEGMTLLRKQCRTKNVVKKRGK